MEEIGGRPQLLERVTPQDWGSLGTDERAAERHLQEILAQCPELLALTDFGSAYAPAVCVGREVSTPAGPVDAVFVSDQGRVVLVETKLHKNPEARREVVAQLLDYVSHVAAWSYRDLDAAARAFAAERFPAHAWRGLHAFVAWRLADAANGYEPPMDEDQFLAEVDRALAAGELLGLVVGDHINPRAVRLADFARSHPGLGFDLGLVELGAFRRPGTRGPVVFVPRIVQRTEVVARTVVEVRDRTHTGVVATVAVEGPADGTTQKRRRAASEAQYFTYLRESAPASEPLVRELVALFEALATASGGRFELQYQSATANFYWRESDEQTRRIFVLSRKGEVGVWLQYLRDAGRDDLAAVVEEHARAVLPLAPGRQMAKVAVTPANLAAVRAAVTAAVTALGQRLATSA